MAEHNNKFQQFKKPADQKSAGEVEDMNEKIRVVATADGIYESKRIVPGMELVIPRRLFSHNWMKIKEQE